MLRNIILSGLVLIAFQTYSQNLEQIRSDYPLAESSEQVTLRLNDDLASVTSDQTILMAYKGALKTLQAKFAKKIRDKKEFFKEGVALIEKAIQTEPENVELRMIRMTVQENAPRIVGYNDKIDEDKNFILQNFATITSESIRTTIRNFANISENFDASERERLD